MRLFLIALMLMVSVGASQAYAQTVAHTCGAMTSKGQPCKMRVKAVGAKCHHHNGKTQDHDTGEIKETHFCGAKTQKGTPCNRRVAIMGAKCFSHKK